MDCIGSIRAAIDSRPQVLLAVIFGSYARGHACPNSDIDVGLILTDGSASARREIEVALGRAAGRDLDVVYLDDSPPQLRYEIARDGVLVIERRPHAWAEFRAHAMLDWWDWAPTARSLHHAAMQHLRAKVVHGQS
jgi:predicted nucleotidyltransferase